MSDTDPPSVADQAFARRAAATFAASTARLDARRLSRLRVARETALAELRDRPFRVPGLLLPAGALATVAALALAVALVGRMHTGVDAAPVEDVEILAARDGFELYSEDPEFYEWASNLEASGSASDATNFG